MVWIGKAVGGVLGFTLGGLIGSVLGVALGHQFDRGAAQLSGGAGMRFGSERVRQRFFETTFAVMGHIAKADGRVSESEIRAARRIMHGMGLSPAQVKVAIDHFTAGKSARYPLAERLRDLGSHLQHRTNLVTAFVEIQIQAVIAAGPIDKPQRELLWRVARELGMGRVELAQIEARVRAQHDRMRSGVKQTVSLEQAYRVLGLDPEASDRDVKTAYRRLMNQHHPDKLVARGLPESMTGVAEEKTHEIRAAYERIKAQRHFK